MRARAAQAVRLHYLPLLLRDKCLRPLLQHGKVAARRARGARGTCLSVRARGVRDVSICCLCCVVLCVCARARGVSVTCLEA